MWGLDLDVDGADIDTHARNAMRLERLVVGNPRRVEESDMRDLFENSR